MPPLPFSFGLLSRFVQLHLIHKSTFSRYCRPNAYALVTGSSDGIGLAIAGAIASRGINIVLQGRNPTKLESVRAKLASAYPKQDFRVAIADAANSHGMKKAIEAMAQQVAELPGPLTVLVNNVGGTGMLPELLVKNLDTAPEHIDAVINLNLRFPSQLTRALLPQMLQHEPCLVINVSSAAGLTGLPYFATYSGAKAYLLHWGSAIAREMQTDKRDVEVLGIVVGQVTSVGWLKLPATFFMPTAETMAEAILACVGCGRLIVTAYWTHALRLLPFYYLSEEALSGLLTKNFKESMAGIAGSK